MITLVICTYNRSEHLSRCLESLCSHWNHELPISLVIVDNGSTDNTYDVIKHNQDKLPLKYLCCQQVGLSYARNFALENTTSEWLTYLDDDCTIGSTFLDVLSSAARKEMYTCFGGPYMAKHLEESPPWLPSGFGTMVPPRIGEGPIFEPKLAGGNFTIKRKVLLSLRGFEETAGMIGNKIGYGEETLVQQKLLDQGYNIGYYPDLFIHHYVLPHKYSLNWHFKSKCQRGKTYKIVHNKNWTANIFAFMKSTLSCFLVKLPINFIKYLFTKNYYRQNLMVDSFGPLVFSWCRLWYQPK